MYRHREVPAESASTPCSTEAWIDHDKTIIGDEIPFTRRSWKANLRPLEEIDAELLETEARFQELLDGLKR